MYLRRFVLYKSSWVGVSFTQSPSHGADVRCKLFLVSSCSSSLENVSPGTKFTDIAGLVRRICSRGLCFARVRYIMRAVSAIIFSHCENVPHELDFCRKRKPKEERVDHYFRAL